MLLQQLAHHDVLLRRRQQPDRRPVELARGVAAYEPVGEGVDGRAQGRARGATEPGRHAVAQLLGCLAREGERQDLGGVGAAVLDPVGDRLDQRGRLAGAGAGQDEQRAARVVDDALLLGVEGDRLGGGRGRHEVVRRGPGRHGSTQPSDADRAERGALG
jgi:hypothetical protein